VYLILRRCRSSDVLCVSDDGLMIYEVVFFQPLLFRVCTFFFFRGGHLSFPHFFISKPSAVSPPYIYTLLAVSCLYFIYSYVSFHRIEPVGGAYMGFIFLFFALGIFCFAGGVAGKLWDISIGI